MKLVAIILLVVAIATGAGATFIPFAWDASTTPGVTYQVYGHTNELAQTNYRTAAVRFSAGTSTAFYVEGIAATSWFFCCTAVKDGAESDISNILPVDVPQPTGNFRTLVVQYGGTLTNWMDVGFFRVLLR